MPEDQEKSNAETEGAANRRTILTAAASALVVPAVAPVRAGAQSARAAAFYYKGYSQGFSSKYFDINHIVNTVTNIKKTVMSKDKLFWGEYQKLAAQQASTDEGWDNGSPNGKWMFENWESAVKDARDDLKKQRPDVSWDPDNPNARAKNMAEHLDEAVRVALFDKYLPSFNPPHSGIPITVTVEYQPSANRRHTVTTTWVRTAEPSPRNVSELKIHMICPSGGWIAYATWPYAGGLGKITRFAAEWTVPKAPKDENQVVFIFNGLESLPEKTSSPAILQPVLQWTKNHGWVIRSWYVPASYRPDVSQLPPPTSQKLISDYPASPGWTINDPLWTRGNLRANGATISTIAPGDRLRGVITLQGGIYTSACWHRPKNGSTFSEAAKLSVPGLPELDYGVATIEAYKLDSSDVLSPIPKQGLPDLVEMTAIAVNFEQGSGVPVWDIGNDGTNGQPNTNKLKRYTITKPTTSSLTFTLK